MERTSQSELERYLKLLDSIKARVEDERTAVVILQELNKDRRMASIREERQNGNGHSSANSEQEDQPATEKQLAYLRKLGASPSEGLTKHQASKLIDEALEKESEQDSSPYVAQNVPSTWHESKLDITVDPLFMGRLPTHASCS